MRQNDILQKFNIFPEHEEIYMVARPIQECQRCNASLNEQGSCSNETCQSNNPTRRPPKSGQRLKENARISRAKLSPATCRHCKKDFDPASFTCTLCGTPRSASETYDTIRVRGPAAQRVPHGVTPVTVYGFNEEPPTQPGTPSAKKKSSRPT